MLMVLLQKEKYDLNEFSDFLTSSSSEGWTFPAVLRLRIDIVDLKHDYSWIQKCNPSSITTVYDTVPQHLLDKAYCQEKEVTRKAKCKHRILPKFPNGKPFAVGRKTEPVSWGWIAKQKSEKTRERSHIWSTLGDHQASAHRLSWLTVFGRRH